MLFPRTPHFSIHGRLAGTLNRPRRKWYTFLQSCTPSSCLSYYNVTLPPVLQTSMFSKLRKAPAVTDAATVTAFMPEVASHTAVQNQCLYIKCRNPALQQKPWRIIRSASMQLQILLHIQIPRSTNISQPHTTQTIWQKGNAKKWALPADEEAPPYECYRPPWKQAWRADRLAQSRDCDREMQAIRAKGRGDSPSMS